jgi:ankyrin repeat protein
MEPEVVMNLWVFVQSIGPIHVIYELGVRPYVMSGSDDEMTKLLKELAVSDFHFARRFPLPDRYYLKVREEGGRFIASTSSDPLRAGERVRKGLALVRPDISGMQQMEYFPEALDVVEKSLPARRVGIDGVEKVPIVNRGSLLSVITNVNVDDKGNQVARLDDPRRYASPSAVVNLWMFRDEKAKAICALSGRGYMVHGSDSDKARILKTLARNDFSMVKGLPVPESFSTDVGGKFKNGGVLTISSDNTYSRDLFNEVYQAIEHEIPTAIGIDGKIKNPVAITACQSMSIATQITEHANKTADATPISLVSAPSPPKPSGQSERPHVLRVSVRSMKGNVSKVGNRCRFQIRVEGDNSSSLPLGWSGVTINVPTINSREQYSATEFEMSSMACNPPSRYGPGDEIWGFRDDGSFGKKTATSLLMECVREQWPPHERIALEVVLVTSCPKLDVHVRVWSTRPDTRDGFGDPDWQAATQKDQQGISAYPMSLQFGIFDQMKHLFRARFATTKRPDAKPAPSAKPEGSSQALSHQPAEHSGGWVVRYRGAGRYVYVEFFAEPAIPQPSWVRRCGVPVAERAAAAADQLRAVLLAPDSKAMMAALAAVSDHTGISARAVDDPRKASAVIEETARELATSLGLDNKKRDAQETALKPMQGSGFLAPDAVRAALSLARLFRGLSIASDSQLQTAEAVPLQLAVKEYSSAAPAAVGRSAPPAPERAVAAAVSGPAISPEPAQQIGILCPFCKDFFPNDPLLASEQSKAAKSFTCPACGLESEDVQLRPRGAYDSDLVLAAQDGDQETARKVLDKGADVNAKSGGMTAALILASQNGHEGVVELLLAKGADPNAKTKSGDTALILASQEGRYEVVKMLLAKGADANAKRTNDGTTALHQSSQKGHLEVVKALLDKGADVNAKRTDDGTTALHLASWEGHWEVAKTLLDKKADINAKRTNGGATALIVASSKGHREMVLALLGKGADVNAKRTNDSATALMAAISGGYLEVAQALLSHGAEINAKDSKGNMALHAAVENGQKDVVALLIAGKADVNARSSSYDAMPLHLAAAKGYIDLVELLLVNGADIKAGDSKGASPLHYAAHAGHKSVAKLLLSKGAEVNAKSNKRSTPLHFATLGDHSDVAELLLAKGADIEAKDTDSATPLLLAAYLGRINCAKLLLEKKANVNATSFEGATPLRYAASQGHTAIANLVRQHGGY